MKLNVVTTGIEAHHYSVMRAHLFDRHVCRHTHSMQEPHKQLQTHTVSHSGAL